jgi:para-nitrobenzyl esterase
MRSVVLAAALLFAAPALAAPQVTVAQGALTGTSDNGIDAYKGIPYAAPPVGDLRWRAPQPAVRWKGARDAAAFGPACLQHPTEGLMVRANLPQSEDCLTLNIWTPQARGAKLPVMVWIHGGGFTQGASSVPRYDGAALARHGVVLVSINYRLGRLGFFALPALAAEHPNEPSGNYGLLDQIAALKWLRDNIAAFGGDPRNVTIFGESAGGVSVEALMTSPLAKGLFAKAISESGGTFGTPSLSQAQSDAQAVATKLNATGPDALKTLRALPGDQVVGGGEDELGPMVDGQVLPEDVATAFAKGHFAALPFLAGTNSNEGSLLGNGDASWLDKSLGDRLGTVRTLYEKDGKLSDDQFHRLLFNDEFFAGPTAAYAAAVNRAGAPAYVYRFGYLADVMRRRGETGVGHGGEMIFLFGFGQLAAFAPPNDTAMSSMLQAYWTNFAKTGDPNGIGVPVWPKFEGAAPQTLVLDDHPHAVADFHRAQFGAVR